MRIACEQKILNQNLSLVLRAVPNRPSHPILGNILAIADKETQQVTLTAFDLSLGIETSFAAQVDTEGSITLPAKLLVDIISKLPDGELTLDDEDSEDFTITITSASGRYEVRGMTADEYPQLPSIESEVINLPSSGLLFGLKGTLFATSPDETKQVLTGVHVKVEKDILEFASTDGHRLAVVQTTSQNIDEDDEDSAPVDLEFEVTVPSRAMRELERMLGTCKPTDLIALQSDQGQIMFALGNQRIISRTLEGQYPAYRQLLPRNFERRITVDRRSFLSALERIGILANQKNDIVKVSINGEEQKLLLSVDAKDIGSASESLVASISGESLELAFNVKYAMESLKNIGETEIQIQLNSATTPVVFTPLGGLKLTHLLMPVQLRN
jgi:DNA polymerase-3 subunit beta